MQWGGTTLLVAGSVTGIGPVIIGKCIILENRLGKMQIQQQKPQLRPQSRDWMIYGEQIENTNFKGILMHRSIL